MKKKPLDSSATDTTIRMLGACAIVAAAAPEAGKPATLPAVNMDVYNGGKINVRYWGHVVVDLAGMKVSDTTPILYAHDTYSIDSIVGQTSSVKVDGKLTAVGVVMGESETVAKVVALAKKGFKFQASMGADPIKTREVPEGESVEANGQTHDGPFTLVIESQLNEVSILPLGADRTTSAAVAASHAAKEGNAMKKHPDGTPYTAEEIRLEAAAEETRLGQVREAAKNHPTIAAKAVTEGWDLSKTTIAVLEAEKADLTAKIEAGKVQNERPGAPSIAGGKPADGVTDRVIEAAACLRAGIKNPEKAFDTETLTRATDLRINSMTDLVRACMALAGKPLNATRHETREFLQAAFSTRSLANVLSAVANKFIIQGYGTVEQTWRRVAGIRPVVDFKANTGVRLILTNLLKNLNASGDIEHGSLSDEARTVQADTKALMLGITRKDIINDDLQVLTELPSRLGYAAARTFNVDFWAAFEAAVAANFSASAPKSNQTTGVLSLATMKVAEKLFLALADADGNPIGAEATTLLVSGTSSATARELFVSTNLTGGSTKEPAANIYAGKFAPAVSRYLSAAPWYLVADPMAIPLMQVAFLNGREEPWVESADSDFNNLGIQMRCWYDYGCSFGDWRAAVRSTGA